MFQVEIEKRTGEPLAKGPGEHGRFVRGRKSRAPTCPQARRDVGAARRPRYLCLFISEAGELSMWKRSGSGLLVRSTLNRETTV